MYFYLPPFFSALFRCCSSTVPVLLLLLVHRAEMAYQAETSPDEKEGIGSYFTSHRRRFKERYRGTGFLRFAEWGNH